LKEKEWQTTKALFASTESLLKTLLTEAEASLFSVATPAPIKEISDDPYFSESRMDWQWHVNYIIVKRDELKKIIERLG
jgi:Zn-finger domain-containing protein